MTPISSAGIQPVQPSDPPPPYSREDRLHPGRMSAHFKGALIGMERALMINVNVNMYLKTRMHEAAGGFMDDEEYALVTNERTQHEQMTKFLQILRGKGDTEYQIFLGMLSDAGMHHWAQAVRDKADACSRMQARPGSQPSAPAGGPQRVSLEHAASLEDEAALGQVLTQLDQTQNQLAASRQQLRQLQSDYDNLHNWAAQQPRQESQASARSQAAQELARRDKTIRMQCQSLELREHTIGQQQERIEVLQEKVARLGQKLTHRDQQLAQKDQQIARLEQQLAAARGELSPPVSESLPERADTGSHRSGTGDEYSLLRTFRDLIDEFELDAQVSVTTKLRSIIHPCIMRISADEQVQEKIHSLLSHLVGTGTIPNASYQGIKDIQCKRDLIRETMEEVHRMLIPVSFPVPRQYKEAQEDNIDKFMNLLKALHYEGCHNAIRVLLDQFRAAGGPSA
ncbi:MAG: hypothetical protein OXC07_08990 [Kistimonas sp.]|nr:hypothetical protein [Kistimonas sp.]